MLVAITREPSSAIGRCELSYLERIPIDISRARAQHREYEQCLASLGCKIDRLPEAADLPDSVFVEDAAIVLDELAVITRPGAESRRAETGSVADALSRYRELVYIEAPATLDGGDVLCLGKRLFVGYSRRSSVEAVNELRRLLMYSGYTVTGVAIRDCLHLKSAATQIAEDALLINPDWVDAGAFGNMRCICVEPCEPFAANALFMRDTVVFPKAFSGTRNRLEAHGIRVTSVDVSELAKAEGGVTCCSLIFSTPGHAAAPSP